MPNYVTSAQQSTFTPEDLYSDFPGTSIGRGIALRILKNFDTLSYSQIATEEIAKTLATLNPLTSKEASAKAYDIVDRSEQPKLPAAEKNTGIWWDSRIIFGDERYCFKQNLNTGPEINPWLVPQTMRLNCPAKIDAEVLHVPEATQKGILFNQYYEFRINPDSALFFDKITGKQLHVPFGAFNSRNFNEVLSIIHNQMEQKLLPGLDKRNSTDPVPLYKGIHKVSFKW